MKQVMASVLSSEEIAPRTYLIWLGSAELAGQARLGQFVMVRCGEETVLRRPLSVHRVAGDKLALLFAVRGKGTEWLAQRQKGEMLDILGPLGNGFNMPPRVKHLLLVAGGIGIAPLAYLAEGAVKSGRQVILLHGAATATHLYPQGALPAGVSAVLATEDGSAGHRGMVTDLIPQYAGGADRIVACGPLPMLRFLAEHRQALKIQGKRVDVSLEMRMGCGLGVCYGCTIRTTGGLKQVCRDGPVFDLKEIIWDEMTRV